MVFSSLTFLFVFLPLLLVVCALCRGRARCVVLLAAGAVFLAYGGADALLPWATVTLAAFLSACFYEKYPTAAVFRCGACAVLLPLFCFKLLPPLFARGLPQGISFYSFSCLAYLAEVRRGRLAAERDLLHFSSFCASLPLLCAGPILDPRAALTDHKTARDRSVRLAAFGAGVDRFCAGLCKKLILGDALAESDRWLRALHERQPTALGAWLVAVCFFLHLYFDFSGYTDMALGMGRMLGLRFPENFDYPVTAVSIRDFWRRWHISLSRWFRDYVYIPLGGNRRGRVRQLLNLFAVWLLTGLWHGTGWNYLVWGGYFAVLLALEHLFLGRLLDRAPTAWAHLYTLVLVLVGFLFFSTASLGEGLSLLGALVGIGTVRPSPLLWWQTARLLPLLAAAAVGATPLPRRLWGRIAYRLPILQPLGALALLVLGTAYLLDSSFLPFAYLNF